MDNPSSMTACVFVLTLLLMSGCNLQYRMLYYPSGAVPSEESLAGRGIRFWPTKEKDYRGFVGPVDAGQVHGTFVVFHGNGGTAIDREFYVRALGGSGYRVILAEYPCYGGRPGELGESSFVKDAVETVRLAHEMYGGPVYLLGESLGAGVAAAVIAATKVPIDGVLLITPWDSLRSVAQHHFRFVPVRLFLKDSYDSTANLSSFRGRVAIVGAEKDAVIPIRHARDLFSAMTSAERKFWVVNGVGHNDWPMRMDKALWGEITKFVTGEKEP